MEMKVSLPQDRAHPVVKWGNPAAIEDLYWGFAQGIELKNWWEANTKLSENEDLGILIISEFNVCLRELTILQINCEKK